MSNEPLSISDEPRCVEEGCNVVATESVWTGQWHGVPIFELRCTEHAPLPCITIQPTHA